MPKEKPKNKTIQEAAASSTMAQASAEDRDIILPKPKLIYPVLVLKRHLISIIVIALIGAGLVTNYILNFKMMYESVVVVSFDASLSNDQGNPKAGSDPLSVAIREAKRLIEDDRTILEFGQRLGREIEVNQATGLGAKIKSILGKILPESLIPTSWTRDPRAVAEFNYIKSLRGKLDFKASYGKGTFVFFGRATTVEEAKKLALTGANLITEKILTLTIRRFTYKIESWRKSIQADKDKRGEYAGFNEDLDLVPSMPLEKSQVTSLKRRERDLIQRYLSEKDRIAKGRSAAFAVVDQLKAELEQALKTKGYRHPLIARLSRDLEKAEKAVTNDPNYKLQDELHKQLFEVQKELKAAGEPIDLTVASIMAGYNAGGWIGRLEESIRRFSLEIKSLQDQLKEPLVRNRMKVAIPPTTNLIPTNKADLFKKAGIGVGVTLGLAILVAVLLELLDGRARDTWRIGRALNMAILNEFSRKDLKGYGSPTPSKLHVLKEKLGVRKASKKDKNAAYEKLRHIEKELKNQNCDRILVIGIGAEKEKFEEFFSNFAEIIAHDSASQLAVIDFDDQSSSNKSDQGMYDVLSGDVGCKDVVQNPDETKSYAYLPSGKSQNRYSLVTTEKLGEAVDFVNQDYSSILVKGLPSGFTIENLALQGECNSIIVIVDTTGTTLGELKKLRGYMDPWKTTGFIALG